MEGCLACVCLCRAIYEGLTEFLRGEELRAPRSVRRSCKHFRTKPFIERQREVEAGGIYSFAHDAGGEDGEDIVEVGEYDDVDYGGSEPDLHPDELDGEEGDDDNVEACSGGHAPDGRRCVAPIKLKASRLSNELGPLYSVQWNNLARKPDVLERLGRCSDFPETLVAVAYRENGTVIYGEKPLWESRSFRWLLTCGLSQEELFCRLPLLLTPILESLALSSEDVLFVADRRGKRVKKVDDGMARISEATMRAAGLWDKRHLAFQFRGIVHSATAGASAIVKGMARFDPGLGNGVAFPKSTRKAGAAGRGDVGHALDVVKWTDRTLREPWLNGSFASALHLGIRLLPEGLHRGEGYVLWSKLLMSAKEGTLDRLVRDSWNVPRKAIANEHFVARPGACEPIDTWVKDASIVDAHKVDFAPLGARRGLPETPSEVLLQERAETAPHTMAHGRKENLLRGRSMFWGRYQSLLRKPRLHLPGFGATLTCLVDISGTLRDQECYVMVGGVVHLGECTVWRCLALSLSRGEIAIRALLCDGKISQPCDLA